MRKRLLAALALTLVGTAEPQGPYQPQDKDERGLWLVMEEEERKLQTSNFVMHDPALNAYVRGVFCRMVGPRCSEVRIYITRTPYFNASMAPNGAMIVFSGLFLRTRDEAQMAAVLGHEYTHYTGRHSLRLWRDARSKTNAIGFLSVIPIVSWGALAALSVAQIGLAGSVYAFSRDMEREADTGSIGLLANAGYDPGAASKIWEEIRAEQDATAAARGKRSRKNSNGGIFATHPPTAERMTELKALAARATVTGTPVVNREDFLKALAPHWASFVDDQIKLNDFGGTELLLGQLASEGWSPELLYARGELYRARGKPEDFAAAAGFYRQAIAAANPPVEAWRGLGLALLRSGQAEEGKAALKTYLGKRPDAPDRAILVMMSGGSQ